MIAVPELLLENPGLLVEPGFGNLSCARRGILEFLDFLLQVFVSSLWRGFLLLLVRQLHRILKSSRALFELFFLMLKIPQVEHFTPVDQFLGSDSLKHLLAQH